MDNDTLILNYLREKKKALSVDEIACSLKLDSFLVRETLERFESELRVKPKGNKYMATDYKTGFMNICRNGKGYIKYNNSRIWISSNKLHGALDDDTVLVDITSSNKDNYEGEVVNILERYKKNNVGTVIIKGGEYFIKGDKEPVLIEVKDNIVLGEKVIYVKHELVKDNIYTGSIVRKIGHIDDPKMDIFAKLAEFNISTVFNPNIVPELKSMPTEVKKEDLVGRADLRDEMIFTIDGDDTKDIDDAVSLKINEKGNYVLGVHIADVSHYINVGSELDKEAYQRGTSVYPPGAVIPMFPHEISSGICSLFSDVDRLTMTCEMEYDASANLISYKIYPSVIKSRKQMAYSKVNKVLDGEVPYGYDDFVDVLKLMNQFKDKLNAIRFKQGSINFDINNVKVVVDSLGKPIDVHKEVRGDAEKLIEEFMLAANVCVATDLSNYGESLYRVHDEPHGETLQTTLSILKRLGIKIPKGNIDNNFIKKLLNSISTSDLKDVGNEMVLRSMAKAIYSKDNIGHFGLAFPKYTHFTSPIRRYPDLTVHRLLKHYHGFENVSLSNDLKDYLNIVGVHSSFQERNADYLESSVRRMKMAEYLDDSNEEFEGKIISITPKGMDIELYNGIIGFLPFEVNAKVDNIMAKTKYKIYKLGDTLTVSVWETNKLTGDIKFKEKVKTK